MISLTYHLDLSKERSRNFSKAFIYSEQIGGVVISTFFWQSHGRFWPNWGSMAARQKLNLHSSSTTTAEAAAAAAAAAAAESNIF